MQEKKLINEKLQTVLQLQNATNCRQRQNNQQDKNVRQTDRQTVREIYEIDIDVY